MTPTLPIEEKMDSDWCEHCHAHVIPMSLGELAWSWVCYRLALVWPDCWFVNRTHLAILPWAGNIAFRCTCLSKQKFARRSA